MPETSRFPGFFCKTPARDDVHAALNANAIFTTSRHACDLAMDNEA